MIHNSSIRFRLISTLLVAKYIHNFGRKTMYFISAATTIIFQVLFGVIDILDLGYTWKICPLIVICSQVTFCRKLVDDGTQKVGYRQTADLSRIRRITSDWLKCYGNIKTI